MANPKKRTSKSKSGHRRAHQALTHVNTINCSNCGEPKLRHHVCGNCGHYKDRAVLQIEND